MKSERRWIAVALLLTAFFCACYALAALGVGAGSYGLWRTAFGPNPATLSPTRPDSPTQPVTSEPSPTPAGRATATPLSPNATVDPAIQAQMEEIQDQVVELRGLAPDRPVSRDLITPGELRQRLVNDILKEYDESEAAADARLLALLGLLPADFALRDLYLELYSEQVAGFFDSETQEMVVVQEATFGGVERATYAHEYDHVLQDQHYQLRDGLGLDEQACEQDSERCTAIQALVEGDATLLQLQWLRIYATEQDRQEIAAASDPSRSLVFATAPEFLKDGLLFPYTYGLIFVQTLYREGGWAAVDAAFADPPRSTEQILHPERYPTDLPVALETPDLLPSLGAGWEELDRGVLGEWTLRWMLREVLPIGEANNAAEGWGGDVVLAFHHAVDDRDALIVIMSWDSIREAQDFAAAFLAYGTARFGDPTVTDVGATWEGGPGYSVFERVSDQTLWILAPDAATAQAMRSVVPFPVAEVSGE